MIGEISRWAGIKVNIVDFSNLKFKYITTIPNEVDFSCQNMCFSLLQKTRTQLFLVKIIIGFFGLLIMNLLSVFQN